MNPSEMYEHYLQEQKAFAYLSAVVRKGHIPHAMLFAGIEGTGRRAAATALAMACNCEQAQENNGLFRKGQLLTDACTCRSCRKIRSGQHPDIHRVEPSGSVIKIDQVRDLCRTLSMRPYEAKVRVSTFFRADSMNPEAGNALLKVLEEPPDRTILILMADRPGDLLPTLLSRCQTIRFSPLSAEAIARILMNMHGLAEGEARVMAMLAGGSLAGLDTPEGIRRLRDRITRRNWLMEVFAGMVRPDAPAGLGLCLAFAEKLAVSRDAISEDLDVLESWLRDIVICRYTPGRIINRDQLLQIGELARKIPVPALLSHMEAVQTARKHLRANASLRLTLDALMLRLIQGTDDLATERV